jgi:anti-repressor protein
MNELIKIHTNENGQAVSARDLYEALGMHKDFSAWFKYQSNKLGLQEGLDFSPILGKTSEQGGRPSTDYIIPIDIAKHLAMISGGENAHKIREYFIQVEKAWNSPEMVMARSLKFAAKQLESYQKEIALLKPKAEFFDAVADSKTAIEIGEAAKVLNMGIGRNNLFKFLRQQGILMENNQPYQEYIDRGYFRVIEQRYTKPDGSTHINIKTLVYQRGLDYIRKLLKKPLIQV